MAPAPNDRPARPLSDICPVPVRGRVSSEAPATSSPVVLVSWVGSSVPSTLALATWRRSHTTGADLHGCGGIPGPFALGDRRPFAPTWW